MMEIVFGILIAVILDLLILLFYAGSGLREQMGFGKKMSYLFKRTKAENVVLIITFIACLVTFFVSRYVYGHTDVFWSYKWEIAIGILIPIAVIDYKSKIIPNTLLLIGLILTVLILSVQIIINTEFWMSILGNSLLGAAIGGGIFLIAGVFVKNGIGAGDIKMFFILGILLAVRGIFNVLLYSMVISAISGIVLLIRKKKTTKDELPLAPFTLIGIVVSIMFGV